MLTAALAVLCALLVLVLLVQRPAIWPVLVVLAVLWFALFGVFRYRVRSWVARWVCGGSFEKSKTQFSLEPLSQPAALLSGETVLWYNTEFRTRLMKGEALLVPRVQKVLPGLDLQEARKVSGQLLNLADGVWSAHSSTVPGEAESMTLLVLRKRPSAKWRPNIRPAARAIWSSLWTATTTCSAICWTASAPACWKASTGCWKI